MVKVMAKQKHQINIDQLPLDPVQLPMLATREKTTQVDNRGSRQRRSRGWVSAGRIPMMVGDPRPEDINAVLVVLRVTGIGMAAILGEDGKNNNPAHLEKPGQST
jgi:hypothetical protein